MSEMSRQNDGGPAFPVFCDQTSQQLYGMNLRDHFAANALQGLLAEPMWEEDSTAQVLVLTRDTAFASPAERFASAAYQIADAMLAERERHS